MRVMFLADVLGNGGAERQLALLAACLSEKWQRCVYALGGGPFATRLRDQGVPVSVYPWLSRHNPLPLIGLWRSFAAFSPDIVHSWGWMSTMAIGPLCRARQVPLVDGTIRYGVRKGDHPHLRRLSRAFATTVVANNEAGLLASKVPREKGAVVYNGFDWSRLGTSTITHGEDRPADGLERPFTVVMTGRMVPVKDFRTVIRAARLLYKDNRAWRFVLIGDGRDRIPLMAESTDLVNEGAVQYPEPGLEVLDHVRNADAGVLMTDPTYGQEGLSNSIMEYMACGLPVVCSEGGGNREVVVDQTTGFMVAPFDAESLASKLTWLREHPSESRSMGEAGRQRIRDVFSIERMVASYESIYENAIEVSRRH